VKSLATAFWPVDRAYEAQQHLASLPPGERVEAVIYRAHNPKFAGMVYKTMRLIGAAMQWRAHTVRGWLLIRTGRADVVRWPNWDSKEHVRIPHGTGPSDMGQAELEAFWDDACEVIRKEVLSHVDAMAAEEIGRHRVRR